MEELNMHKRIITALLTAVMCLGMTACTSSGDRHAAGVVHNTPQLLLGNAWNRMDEAEKPTIMGGFGDDLAEDEPKAVNLKNAEALSTTFTVPEDVIQASSAGAAMMNAMMANFFTASSWAIKDPAKIEEFAAQSQIHLENNQWLCGMPEYYAVAQCGDNLVVTYGLRNTVRDFVSCLEKADSSTKIIMEGNF